MRERGEQTSSSCLNLGKDVAVGDKLHGKLDHTSNKHNSSRPDNNTSVISTMTNGIQNSSRGRRSDGRSDSHTSIENTSDRSQSVQSSNCSRDRDGRGQVGATAETVGDGEDKHYGDGLGERPEEEEGQGCGKSRDTEGIHAANLVRDQAHDNTTDG